MQLYKPNDVARLTGVNVRTLNYWANTEMLPPVRPSNGRGRTAGYSFRDLVAVRAVVRLREAGVSLQALRKVAEFIRGAHGAADNAEALAGVVLAVSGDDVAVIKDGIAVSALREPGQMFVLAFNVGAVVDEIKAAVRAAA